MGTNIFIPFLFLICLIIIEMIKKSNNDDLIKENCKSQEQYENIKNAKKVFHQTKTANFLLILAIATLIIFILCDFTSIEATIIDYISADFFDETKFDRTLYFVPFYILIAREIIIQVKIGEFLLKYFNVKEPVLEENIIKTILYKKKKPIKINFTKNNNNESKDNQESKKDSQS